MKERVTLTIEKEILEKVDDTINNVDVKNRSHAVELLLTKALGENKPVYAVILAGGHHKGSADKLPKSMARVQNKPLLEYNLELVKKYGVKNIILCVGEKNELIKEYFADGSELGMEISYFEEKDPLGTAGPLSKLKNKLNSTFILMNADELKNIDLDDLFDFHKKNKGVATVALTTTDDPSKYGVAVMNGNKISAFVEKPEKEHAPSKLINAGLYIFEPEVLKLIPEGFSTIEHDILPRLARENKLVGYVFSGQWFDTTTNQKINEAELEWKGLE